MQGYRTIDLNIFYREDWSEEAGTTWSDKLTIEPYIYESDGNGTRKYDTGVLIECDFYETAWIADQFPMDEYGSDFCVFAEQLQSPTRRITKILRGIEIDQIRKDPSIVITASSTM